LKYACTAYGDPWNRPGIGPVRVATSPTVIWEGVTPTSDAVLPAGVFDELAAADEPAAAVDAVEAAFFELEQAAARTKITTKMATYDRRRARMFPPEAFTVITTLFSVADSSKTIWLPSRSCHRDRSRGLS
jgi:hypothetical protein